MNPLFRMAAIGLMGGFSAVSAAEQKSPATIRQELRGFRSMGRVLYVAAHPDDENTQLIAYLALGRGYSTAYLSLTRGDGGQNVLGDDFGEKLGVVRTQELLAARRLDGGRQFFSRAFDFGFSKDYRETLRIWDRRQVLADVVRVIRSFRPDVMITRFSPVPGKTHGHHTASAVVALEAFKLAGDPKAFPEQLKSLKPWQPKRILWNVGRFDHGAQEAAKDVDLLIDIGGRDLRTGQTFSEIAARSRSMHKTQGFADYINPKDGAVPPEGFHVLAGEPASKDILDGVDTDWTRAPGGAEIARLADDLITKFDSKDPAASVPGLLALKNRVASLPEDPIFNEKRRQLDLIIADCLGLFVETTTPRAEVVAGEALSLRHTAIVRSKIPVRWLAVRYPPATLSPIRNGQDKSKREEPIDLRPGEAAARETSRILPVDTPLSQPYWLREDHSSGMFRVVDQDLIGLPDNPTVFPIEQVFEVGGQTFTIPDEPVETSSSPSQGDIRRRLSVIAPVAVRFTSAVQLFAPGSTRPVELEVTAYRPSIAGNLRLRLPPGWLAAPEEQPVRLQAPGEKARFIFNVTAPQKLDTAALMADLAAGGKHFSAGRVEIRYGHIPEQLLFPRARMKAVSLRLTIHGRRIGYLPGAGDQVAQSLEQMGYAVTVLSGSDITPEKLKDFDAIVTGIRAFNVRTDLTGRLPALFSYAQAGGTVVEQYNRPDGLKMEVSPLSLSLSQDRVTDENAPVAFLAPEHPALTTPNKIARTDFDGWVQERGLYFPNQWDERFTPVIACGDPGEAPLKSGILVARYGRGYFVYTSLAWFRQLPAGVPGAYRLFANLVSLGR